MGFGFYGRVTTMKTLGKEDILRMSIPERIQLVEDIWDSIAESADELPLSDAQKTELDFRLDAYHANPDGGSSWEEVRKRIQGRK